MQERNVFLIELLLKRFRGRGDDHAAAAADCRQEIGQGLSGAGACFQDGVVVVLEGIVHRFRHLQLAGAVFVAADHAFLEEATGTEDRGHGGLCAALLALCGGYCCSAVRAWPSDFTPFRRRMAFDVVRAGLFIKRHVDALGNPFSALFVGLLEIRFGCAFSQRACPIPGNHGLNS